MFFVTYLRRELRRRMRQAIFIALGLAVGVGLVITVTAASAGVKNAQAGVLKGLYGVGTDVTVTGKTPSHSGPPSSGKGTGIQISPSGAQICHNGKCHSVPAGYTFDTLTSGTYGPLSASAVAEVAKLHDVTRAAGGLTLTDNSMVVPSQTGGGIQPPKSFSVDGADISHDTLGPLSNARLSVGRSFQTGDSGSDVAVVDSNYATANGWKVGSTISVAGTHFKVIGIVRQPQGSNPPAVYIPLARAQALATGPDGNLKNDVNTIYVTAASASDITAVQNEIAKLLPGASVTTPSSLASEVTGSLASTAKLANDLGRWLSILVLIAAAAVACLLTMAAVSRRVREFGTLKALGWRGTRIIAQVMGESVAMGVLGAAAGVGLGFAGAAVIDAIAPKLSATVSQATGMQISGPSGTTSPTVSHTVAVPMSATVTTSAIAAAVILAVAGGVLAGSFGSWRAARLRPAAALSRVG
jgi:putative ABC transport system permease protein